jgi:hypothetical protein
MADPKSPPNDECEAAPPDPALLEEELEEGLEESFPASDPPAVTRRE